MNQVFFEFEADFVESLRCIPMQVRYKLDTCGIKLKLADWHKFTVAERETLVTQSCEKAGEIALYKELITNLVTEKNQTPPKTLPVDPHPPWLDATKIPIQLQEKLQEIDLSMSAVVWANLTPLQRFALLKLSRPGHENQNFYPALQEFGIVSS